jgi:hypothetical protein
MARSPSCDPWEPSTTVSGCETEQRLLAIDWVIDPLIERIRLYIRDAAAAPRAAGESRERHWPACAAARCQQAAARRRRSLPQPARCNTRAASPAN